jgi:hypothetical protein
LLCDDHLGHEAQLALAKMFVNFLDY